MTEKQEAKQVANTKFRGRKGREGSVQITLYLNEETRNRFKSVVSLRGESMSEIVEGMMCDYISLHNPTYATELSATEQGL